MIRLRPSGGVGDLRRQGGVDGGPPGLDGACQPGRLGQVRSGGVPVEQVEAVADAVIVGLGQQHPQPFLHAPGGADLAGGVLGLIVPPLRTSDVDTIPPGTTRSASSASASPSANCPPGAPWSSPTPPSNRSPGGRPTRSSGCPRCGYPPTPRTPTGPPARPSSTAPPCWSPTCRRSSRPTPPSCSPARTCAPCSTSSASPRPRSPASSATPASSLSPSRTRSCASCSARASPRPRGPWSTSSRPPASASARRSATGSPLAGSCACSRSTRPWRRPSSSPSATVPPGRGSPSTARRAGRARVRAPGAAGGPAHGRAGRRDLPVRPYDEPTPAQGAVTVDVAGQVSLSGVAA